MTTIKNSDDVLMALGNNVLISMLPEDTKNSAGVFLPDMAQERETCGVGVVLNYGNIGEEFPIEEAPKELKFLVLQGLKVGSKVLLKKFDYIKVKSENPEDDIRIYDAKVIIGILR